MDWNCCQDKDYTLDACKSRLNNCPNYKAYPRVYLQYNELVFNGIQSVETADLSGDFKLSTTPYPFKHGSYASASFKKGQLLMNEQDLSLDIRLPFINLTRTQVLDYYDFIMYNLTRAGKIWAIDTGGKLIWANAIPKHPPYSDYEIKTGNVLALTMDFLLPDGVWHIAETQHVFLEPYDLCDFKDSFGTGCSHDCNSQQQCISSECTLCNDITPDMNYCETCWNPYDNCYTPYRIIYNCAKSYAFFGTSSYGEEYLGDCDCLNGEFCVNTIYDAEVTVTLLGHFINPSVNVNDTIIRVKGDYDGRLVFEPDGIVKYYRGEPCDPPFKCPTQISFDKIEYVQNDITFYAHRGDNFFNVTFDKGSSQIPRAYISVAELSL